MNGCHSERRTARALHLSEETGPAAPEACMTVGAPGMGAEQEVNLEKEGSPLGAVTDTEETRARRKPRVKAPRGVSDGSLRCGVEPNESEAP